MKLNFVTASEVFSRAQVFIRADSFATRKKTLKNLIFLAVDKTYNSSWKGSHFTRKAVVEALLQKCFPQVKNPHEEELIISGIKKIVFSKQTLLPIKGEAAPEVQSAIINNLDLLLQADQKVEEQIKKMTTTAYFAKVRLEEIGRSLLHVSSLRNPYLIPPPPPVSKQEYKSVPLSRSTKTVVWQILQHYTKSRVLETRRLAKAIMLKHDRCE
ncbi:hypothetical protein KKD62_03440 [Patescibacteria group bacterium]|nr:hypothetical protein [Patescibacteria group bacterium]MBU1931341.1 hypothetical protein [Patescibacteria group bacterium]